MTEKPITISEHAFRQMQLRGTEEAEIILTVRSGNKRNAKSGRLRRRYEFNYNNLSPVNNQFYNYKAVEVIFMENPNEIIVITAIVYYYN